MKTQRMSSSSVKNMSKQQVVMNSADFLKIFTLATIFQNLSLQCSKTLFMCGPKSKARKKSYIYQKYLCTCGCSLDTTFDSDNAKHCRYATSLDV